MFRDDAKGINIRAGAMHAQAIRSECKNLAASCVGGGLGKTFCQRHSAHEAFDESGDAAEHNLSIIKVKSEPFENKHKGEILQKIMKGKNRVREGIQCSVRRVGLG